MTFVHVARAFQVTGESGAEVVTTDSRLISLFEPRLVDKSSELFEIINDCRRREHLTRQSIHLWRLRPVYCFGIRDTTPARADYWIKKSREADWRPLTPLEVQTYRSKAGVMQAQDEYLRRLPEVLGTPVFRVNEGAWLELLLKKEIKEKPVEKRVIPSTVWRDSGYEDDDTVAS